MDNHIMNPKDLNDAKQPGSGDQGSLSLVDGCDVDADGGSRVRKMAME